MFFSLTALGPASLGLPPPTATAPCLRSCLGPLRAPWASPPLVQRVGGVREGGREASREVAARPGTALLCARSVQPLSPCRPIRPAPPPAARLVPTLRPPCTRRGALTFWAPASRLGCCMSPGRPATSSALPPLAPPCCPSAAASLASCQAAWEPSPGRGEGCGSARGGRGPDARPAHRASPCLPSSPESQKGTDNTGGLVKTVLCRSRSPNKGPYLFI